MIGQGNCEKKNQDTQAVLVVQSLTVLSWALRKAYTSSFTLSFTFPLYPPDMDTEFNVLHSAFLGNSFLAESATDLLN